MVDLLEYRAGRPMRAEPLNYTLAQVRAMLTEDKAPVLVRLEPGDATRYDLLLVPVNAYYVREHVRHLGLTAEHAPRWLWVIDTCAENRCAIVPFDGLTTAAHLRGISGNAWTQRFVAWWLAVLFHARDDAPVGEPRGSSPLMPPWERVDITTFGIGHVRCQVETNDNDDDGVDDGHVACWSLTYPSVVEALRAHGGGSHRGATGCDIAVYVDGKEVKAP